MSGPKVFHIVTREEVVAMCQQHLNRLDAAIAEWTRACTRIGIRENEVAAMTARRNALHELLAKDRFTDLQKQVPAEISFLQADAQDRIQKATAAAEEARKSHRRALTIAQTLLDALAKSGQVVPDDLRQNLSLRTLSKAELEAAISKGFELLRPTSKETGLSEHQRNLANQLGQGEARTTLSDWIATRPTAVDDRNTLRLDRPLAELSTIGVDVTSFEARVAAIGDAPVSQRGLLADSLLVELANTLKRAREQARILTNLRSLSAELERIQSESGRTLRAQVESMIAAQDVTNAQDLIQAAERLVQENTDGLASAARRRAVLQGLAALGYEVTEGMNTAWVEHGRIVARKAANPDYGVEVGGGARSNKLQVRAVAFGNSESTRDLVRDRDMETIWCGDFGRLQALVAQNGGSIEIERALEIGSVPLKIIDKSAEDDTATVEDPVRRTLPR